MKTQNLQQKIKPLSMSKKPQGFSMVELLVAMMLGIFLSLGMGNLFLSSNNLYVQDEESARMQENSRYALRYISRELTMSSFMAGLLQYEGLAAMSVTTGCVSGNAWVTDVSRTLEIVNNFSAATTTSVNTQLNCIDDVVSGSDIITVKRTADQASFIRSGGTATGNAEDNQLYLKVEDYGSSIAYEHVASADDGFASAATEVEYWKYFFKALYIRSYSNADGDGIPSLCMASLNSLSVSDECLVEGVESMQIEFGIDGNNDYAADYFTGSPSATESQQIVSAKIYLLMRSVATISGHVDDAIYTLGSTSINGGNAFNDAYKRKIFTTTIKLRNPIKL